MLTQSVPRAVPPQNGVVFNSKSVNTLYADNRQNSVGVAQRLTTDAGIVEFRFVKTNGSFSAQIKFVSSQPTIDSVTEFQINNLDTDVINATLRWHKSHPNQFGAGAPELYRSFANLVTTMAPLETRVNGIITAEQSAARGFAKTLKIDVEDVNKDNYKMRFSNNEAGGRELGLWLYAPSRKDGLSIASGMAIQGGPLQSINAFFPAGYKPSSAFIKGVNAVGNEFAWGAIGGVLMDLASIPMRRGSVRSTTPVGYRARFNTKKSPFPAGTLSIGARQKYQLKPLYVNGFLVKPLR